MIRRRRPTPLMVTLTPVMDVVFLLIIFFILTSHFIEGDVDKLTPAQSPDIQTINKATAYSVSVDADGVVRLQGVPIGAEQLQVAVEGLLGQSRDRRVKVSIDKDLPKQSFLPVIEALSRAGATPLLTGEKPTE